MKQSTSALLTLAAALLPLCGCTTTAAKKQMDKPRDKDAYTGFDPEAADQSKRKAEKVERVKADTDPAKAVETLVANLQKGPAYAIPAEEQLKMWGTQQGVDKIVVSKVRMLLKHEKVEVRAPALRLTILYGRAESNGDLIEALADQEYAIRATASRALQARARRDFSYDPGAGEVARARAVQEWRQWWQEEQRKVAVQPPTVYEEKPPTEPKITPTKDVKGTEEK
ncbi:MAG: hypothetical protein NTW87_32035 [Planctomycetota bacterium]|nr:hypothetical protein [Planctomycetota bacterium]